MEFLLILLHLMITWMVYNKLNKKLNKLYDKFLENERKKLEEKENILTEEKENYINYLTNRRSLFSIILFSIISLINSIIIYYIFKIVYIG